ncbi:MAG: hypothetical protein LKJ90_09140 [Faecalibacterium sp.]|jgi:hypothetical protein|nr:hypothetical protein [Faecalibacterium sp.]
MQHEQKALRMLAAVLLVAALCFTRVPSIGDKAIIRAVLLQENGGMWSVGLLCMQPGSAADSAEATEQMDISWGSGETLPAALAQAEQGLAGTANYKLCDLTAICGAPSMELLRTFATQAAASGKGRLAARVVYCAAPIAAFRQEDMDSSALYAALTAEKNSAPRLYQAESGTLLMPMVRLESGLPETAGAVCLTETAFCTLTQREAEAAFLLQNGQGTISLVQNGGTEKIQLMLGTEVKGGIAAVRAYGLISGLPRQEAAQQAALAAAQATLAARLAEVQRVLQEEAGADLLHTAAFQAQALEQTHRGEPLSFTWYVRLWGL